MTKKSSIGYTLVFNGKNLINPFYVCSIWLGEFPLIAIFWILVYFVSSLLFQKVYLLLQNILKNKKE